jgi:hypothetical protein
MPHGLCDRSDPLKPLLDALDQWTILHRQQIADGSATAKRWTKAYGDEAY